MMISKIKIGRQTKPEAAPKTCKKVIFNTEKNTKNRIGQNRKKEVHTSVLPLKDFFKLGGTLGNVLAPTRKLFFFTLGNLSILLSIGGLQDHLTPKIYKEIEFEEITQFMAKMPLLGFAPRKFRVRYYWMQFGSFETGKLRDLMLKNVNFLG